MNTNLNKYLSEEYGVCIFENEDCQLRALYYYKIMKLTYIRLKPGKIIVKKSAIFRQKTRAHIVDLVQECYKQPDLYKLEYDNNDPNSGLELLVPIDYNLLTAISDLWNI